jgi:hypothetical protein
MSFLRRHPGFEVLLLLHRQVGAKLFAKLGRSALSAE